jgi:hypothetical protein
VEQGAEVVRQPIRVKAEGLGHGVREADRLDPVDLQDGHGVRTGKPVVKGPEADAVAGQQGGVPDAQDDAVVAGRPEFAQALLQALLEQFGALVRCRRQRLVILREKVEEVQVLLRGPLEHRVEGGAVADPDNHDLAPVGALHQAL